MVTSDDLYQLLLAQLTAGLRLLPDKPEETPDSTLRALWHAAAGMPKSAKRANESPLPGLDADAVARLNALVSRRIGGVPLAYLTGRQEFMGIELLAGNEALIPRKETELLARAALDVLRDQTRREGQVTIVDVCTGSGNLALALAFHAPRARVFGADLSREAVALARRNAGHLSLEAQVEFREGDLLAPFNEPDFAGGVDLLVCNPPYISSRKVDELPQEIIGFEPRLAFDGGPLGIRIVQRLIQEAQHFLRPGGHLAFEVGLGQGRGLRKRLEQQKCYTVLRVIEDGDGEARALVARFDGR